MISPNNINILIYSKFSQACRKFIEILENSHTFLDKNNLLCIDNKKVRERVLYNEKMNIREVPSIIRVNQLTGFSEIFEGEKAFLLLQNHIQIEQMNLMESKQQVVPPQSHLPSPPSPPSLPSPPSQPSQPVQQRQTHLVSEEEEISQLPPPPKPKQDSIKKMQKNINNLSSLEELELENDISNRGEKENAVNTYMHVPKSVQFDIESENSQRTAPERTIKSGSGGGNTISKALQMQKEREQESSVTVGVGGYRG